MRYKNLESCTTEELKDLYDTLHMNKCRCMFDYQLNRGYYDAIDADLEEISKILESRISE